MNELINLGNGQMVKVTMLKGERGSNIATITKTGTSGLTDTYTITLTDGSTSTFEVKNGSSIQSITKTSTVGAVDTYTITLTDGTTAGTFTVTNATGTIDQNFSASSTDPLMNKTLSGIIAGVENGSTASKTYNKNDLILRNDSLYEVQTTVASGGTWADGVNIVETTIGDLLSAVKSSLPNGYDWSNKVLLTNSVEYTVPSDGVIRLICGRTTGNEVKLINDTHAYATLSWVAGMSATTFLIQLVPVFKGSKWTVTASNTGDGSGADFIPYSYPS